MGELEVVARILKLLCNVAVNWVHLVQWRIVVNVATYMWLYQRINMFPHKSLAVTLSSITRPSLRLDNFRRGNIVFRRSRWPRGLRRRSAAARLLRLWVRIPPGA